MSCILSNGQEIALSCGWVSTTSLFGTMLFLLGVVVAGGWVVWVTVKCREKD